MTPDIERLKQLLAEIPGGTWGAKDFRVCAGILPGQEFHYVLDTANNKASRTPLNASIAAFVAESRNMLPSLLAELERLQGESEGRRKALLAKIERLESVNRDLLAACEAAKTYLEPDLVEPGRTVFWNLVAAIKKAKETT